MGVESTLVSWVWQRDAYEMIPSIAQLLNWLARRFRGSRAPDADALALSTALMEGCIIPFDSDEIKQSQPSCEQVFIYEAIHFDGTNIQR